MKLTKCAAKEKNNNNKNKKWQALGQESKQNVKSRLRVTFKTQNARNYYVQIK